MKKRISKRAFTLIELLAIIILLSIILVIAVPRIIGAVEESDKETFKITAESLVNESLRQHIQDGMIGEKHFVIEDQTFTGESLNVSGELPDNGEIFIDKEGKIALSISNEKYCAKKNIFSDEIIVNKDVLDCELDTSTPSACFLTQDLSSTEIEIIGYKNECTRDVIIPETIKGKTVTSIGDFAFGYHTNVIWYKEEKGKVAYNYLTSNKQESLPLSVHKELALNLNGDDFVPINSVVIPNTVKTIGESAFEHNLLSSLIIPNGVEVIKTCAFKNNRIESITIPDSVISLGTWSFYSNQLRTYELGIGITKIENYTFAYNDLEKVVITDTVTDIGSDAFYANTPTYLELNSELMVWGINWNSSVKHLKINSENIGFRAFDSGRIETIVFGDNVKTIGYEAFYLNRLTRLELGKNITSIDYNAFSDNDIEIIIFNNKLENIGTRAFGSNNITSLIIPEGVKSIGDSAFSYNQISTLSLPNTLLTIGKEAFIGSQLTSLIIPNNVTSIGNGAFFSNQITSVTIPANVNENTSIGSRFNNAYVYVYGSAAGTYTAPSQSGTWTKQ